jgi:hypothetical protein
MTLLSLLFAINIDNTNMNVVSLVGKESDTSQELSGMIFYKLELMEIDVPLEIRFVDCLAGTILRMTIYEFEL